MGITYNWKGSTDGNIGLGANYDPLPGGSFASDDITVFTSGTVNAPSTGGRNFSNVRFESTYNLGSTITIVPTANTGFLGYEYVYAPDGTLCSVYIAPNKIFWANLLTAGSPSFTYCGGTGTCKIYVDTGGEFRVGYYGGGVVNSFINKLGPGTLWLSYGGNAAAPTTTKGLQLTGGTVAIQSGSYATGGVWGATGAIQFNSGSAILRVEASAGSRTFGNALTFSSGATFNLGSGTTMVFSTAPTSGGTLTLAGAGTLQFTSAAFTLSSAINFTASGVLTMPSGSTLTGATIASTGVGITGTINAGGCTLGNNSAIDASAHAGSITGNCSISGGVSTFKSIFTDAVTIGGGIITLTGASSGSIASVGNFSTLTVRNTVSGGGGSSTTLNGSATLNFAASGKFADTRSIAATASTVIGLSESASIASPINATDTTTITLRTTDNAINTYSGTLTSSGASGTTKVMAFNDGTLVLAGSVTGNAGRTYNLNADSGYAGTIRVTGAGFTTSSVTLSSGKIQLNRAGSIGLGGGLTAAANTTVACYSTGAYAAQLTGNLTLNANSTMKFGAA